jgi:hypothetical protein
MPSIANVSIEYKHRRKLATPGAALTLPGVTLKWTEIASVDAPVPPDVQQRARAFLLEEMQSGRLQLAGELGFVLLHRCGGGDFYFLLPCTWRHDNELWKTTYAKDGDGDFAPFIVQGGHQPAFCVWELGAIQREAAAWDRYLLSPRDGAARLAYLSEQAASEV